MTDPTDRLHEYLDGERSLDGERPVDLTGVPREELARHLLVSGALQQLLGDSGSASATRETVHQGMVAITREEHRLSHRRFRYQVGGALAAAAAVIVTAFALFREPPGIDPVVERMHRFINSNLDRQYKVKAEHRSNHPFANFASTETELSVRGASRFVLTVSIEFFAGRFELLQGYDGKEFWIMPPELAWMRSPVLVSKDSLAACWSGDELNGFSTVAKGLDRIESVARAPLVLGDLRTLYTTERAPKNSETFEIGAGQSAVLATRRAQTDPTYPESIELLIDDDSGAVEQMVTRFARLPTRMGKNPFSRVRYTLESEYPRDDGFYSHSAHHTDRPIVYK